MLKLLRFLLFFGSFWPGFALPSSDLQRKAEEVQQKLHLSDWQVIVRSVTMDEMVLKNQCKCFGETLIFHKSKVAVVNILDDAGYKYLGWTKQVHEHQRFAVLHEVLHVMVEIEHPEMPDDVQEATVRQIAAMVEAEPELQ